MGNLVDEYRNKWALSRDKGFNCLGSTFRAIIQKKKRSEDSYL